MSTLNLIPPTPTTGSPRGVMAIDANDPANGSTPRGEKKSGNGGWTIEDGSTSPIHPLSLLNPTPLEQFQSIMEGLPGFFSGAHPLAKAKSAQPASSEAAFRKKNEADKTGADKAGGGNPPVSKFKTDLATAPDVLISLSNATPAVVELVLAAAPLVSAGETGNIPANFAANPKTESSGFVAADFQRGTSTAAVSDILNQTDGGPANSSAPVQKSGSADDSMDLPETLPPVAGRTPGSKSVPAGNQSSEPKPAHGAPLPQPEKSGDKAPEIQKQPAVITVTNGARPEAVPTLDSTNSSVGTAVAKQDVTMKTMVKETNCSGVKQKLPGAAAVVTGENLPIRSEREVVPATIIIRVDPATPTGTGILADDGPARTVSPEILDLPRIAPSVVPYIQRTQELVSLQVMRLHESGADEMRVVIKPDAGLQLSLHLQQRGGGVEMQAVLDCGNFGLLNRHWPELQQQLELRGVRVAPLANAEPSFGGGSEGFRQPTTSHGQQAGDDADAAEMPPVLLPGLPPATATASASMISSRHLETWA